MLDRFEVFRDAEKTAKAWGEVQYVFPHLVGPHFKPGDRIGVIVASPAGMRYGHMTWGFRASPEQRRGTSIIYEDGMLAGGKYDVTFKSRRCLIPADRWYYHHHNAQQRNWFSYHPKESLPMAFAGLYSSFVGPNGIRVNTVAVIGISSLGFYREYEDRMPAVFLPGPEAIQFLDPRLPMAKAWEYVRNFPEEQLMVEPCGEWATAGE
jgi:putative SOS response-associated peptidase YedK